MRPLVTHFCSLFTLVFLCIVIYLPIRFSQEQYSKKTMPKSDDHIIKPFTLTAHEKSIPTHLADIALSKFHTRITRADERLIPVLTLEILKKKIMYDTHYQQNVASPHKKMATAQSKGGEKRRRKSQNTASVDDEDGTTFQKKRGRASAGGGGDRSSRKHDVLGGGVQAAGGGSARIPMDVLQPQLESVFQVFWDLELEPAALATPFFGLITRNNCDVLGLPRFFDRILESCSLANISVRSPKILMRYSLLC